MTNHESCSQIFCFLSFQATVEFTSLLLPVSHGQVTCFSPPRRRKMICVTLQEEVLRASVCFTMYSFPCSGECGHKGQDGTVLILGPWVTSTTELLDNSCWSYVVRRRSKPFFFCCCCCCQSLTLGLACNYSVILPILTGPNIKWLLLSHFNHIGITGNDGQVQEVFRRPLVIQRILTYFSYHLLLDFKFGNSWWCLPNIVPFESFVSTIAFLDLARS